MREVLEAYTQEILQKLNEMENQDIDAYVEAKLNELRPKIKMEAEQSIAYEIKVLNIQKATLENAIERIEQAETKTLENAIAISELETEQQQV